MRYIRVQRNSFGDICTMIFLYAMQLHFWLESTAFAGNIIIERFRIACFAIALFFVFAKWITNGTVVWRNLLVFGILGILVLYEAYVSGGLTVVKLLLFGLAVKDISYWKITRYFSQINIFIILFVFMSIMFGLIPNDIFMDNGEKYYYMGFLNPNTVALLFFIIVMTLTIRQIYSMSIGHLIVYIVMSSIMYSLTGSRSMMIAAIIYFILIILDRYFSIFKMINARKAFRGIMYSLFPVLTGLSYFLASAYSTNSIVKRLNLLFTWRFYKWNTYVSNINISLLGTNFEWSRFGALDNGYLLLLVRYGIIVWLIYTCMFIYLIHFALQNEKNEILILTITYMAYFFVEGYPIYVNANIVLLYFFNIFWLNSRFEKNS